MTYPKYKNKIGKPAIWNPKKEISNKRLLIREINTALGGIHLDLQLLQGLRKSIPTFVQQVVILLSLLNLGFQFLEP